jgi:hypothetical protein
LFRFYIETESFDVSIEPKQTEDQPKQFDREHILLFFRKFWVVSVIFGIRVRVPLEEERRNMYDLFDLLPWLQLH